MKKLLLHALPWLLLIWFYGGTAYVKWTMPYWFPSPDGHHNQPPGFLISPQVDSTISFILMWLCVIPVGLVAMALNGIVDWFGDWFGYPTNYFRDRVNAISTMVLSFGIYVFVLSARRELRKIKDSEGIAPELPH